MEKSIFESEVKIMKSFEITPIVKMAKSARDTFFTEEDSEKRLEILDIVEFLA